MQRDPLNRGNPGGGYQDAMNLYQMLRGNSKVYVDSSGTHTLGFKVGLGSSLYMVLGGGHHWFVRSPERRLLPNGVTIPFGKEIVGVDLTVELGVGIGIHANALGASLGGRSTQQRYPILTGYTGSPNMGEQESKCIVVRFILAIRAMTVSVP